MQLTQQFPWKFLGIRPTGDAGDYTLYTNRKGKLICFLKTRPSKPLTSRQRANIRQFAAIASVWRSMSPSLREAWRQASLRSGLTITHYNLFVYANMQPNSSTLQTIERQSGIYLGYPPR
jgi:hypothetical protein